MFHKEFLSCCAISLHNDKDISRTMFSNGPPANFSPLQLELTVNLIPVCVKIRNYSADQRLFFLKLMEQLISAGLFYSNPTTTFTSAPHLVPKSVPTRWRFTVLLRPFNR